MSKIEDFFFKFDPSSDEKNVKPLDVGNQIDNLTITLASKRDITIDELLARGPLLLTFVRGIWCPFCRMHMGRLNKWLNTRDSHRGTCIVVSNESPEFIADWLVKNPKSYLFASDQNLSLGQYFGIYVDPRKFSQASTFLIDQEKIIRMVYVGKRTNDNFEKIDQSFLEIKSKNKAA